MWWAETVMGITQKSEEGGRREGEGGGEQANYPRTL